MSELYYSSNMPVLALRGLVVYPKQTVHFDVGREKSAKALENAMEGDQVIMLVPQNSVLDDDPTESQLCSVGTVAKVRQVLKGSGDNLRVLVYGLHRARLNRTDMSGSFIRGTVEPLEEKKIPMTNRIQAMMREANMLYSDYLEVVQHPAQNLQLRMMASDDPGFLADAIAQNSGMDYRNKVELLAQLNPGRRLEMALECLHREIQILQLEGEIQDKTNSAMDQNQREYYLREQMKVIRTELGEDEEANDYDRMAQEIQNICFAPETEEKLLKDLNRLKKQPFGSSEASVLRNYLDTVLDLPWNVSTKEKLDIAAAKKVLDRDHFGLEKVKQRILESLAVRQLSPDTPPQIICLVGPPGVGKTSIAFSIAKCLNRKMARISLGGVHDEADIRGHRKTYVGAMPGRIIQALQQAKSNNPLLLLDEIDKMGSDYRGDPAAALLEVLDGEQNNAYRDHFLEIPFDLSQVFFMCTANTLDTIPRPLLDRMEIIELGSYTDEEKLSIAKDHLVPKQLKKHALKKTQLRICDDAIRHIISDYTRESGVRVLERCIGKICRKTALELVSNEGSKRISVSVSNLETFLGPRKYINSTQAGFDQVGLVTGLAWTSVGGETLEVEVNVMDGSGKLELTGNLGDVMKESAHAAVSFIRAHAQQLGVTSDFYKTKDIHVHFPEAAVPKDGPSAGTAVCTAIVSALTNRPVRHEVAMTGEISIRGRVLPIGGLKEKTMAALRHGIKTVILPKSNEPDLLEIDQVVRSRLEFVTAETVDTVLEYALQPAPVAQTREERVLESAVRGRNPQIRQ